MLLTLSYIPFGGDTGERNTLRGPRYSNVDMALLKTFRLPWEGRTLQFRAEAFNAFNHPSFNTPAVNPNSTRIDGYQQQQHQQSLAVRISHQYREQCPRIVAGAAVSVLVVALDSFQMKHS